MNRYDYNLAEFSLDRAEIRYSADTAIKNCVIVTNAKKLRISSIWGTDGVAVLPKSGLRSTFTDSRGNIYFICGDTIYSYSASDKEFKNPHNRGTIGTEKGYISWAESQSQNTASVYLYFTDGISLWRVNILSWSDPVQNLDSHLPVVNGSDTERGIPSYISYFQHRLLLTCQNSNQWYYSDVDPDSKEKIFNDSNFYSAELKADKLLRVFATDMVYLFGERSVEVWQPTSNNNHPFRTKFEGNYGIGTTYPQSVIDYHNAVYFVATDNCMYGLSNGNIRKVSKNDLNYFFKKNISGCFSLLTNGSRYIIFRRGAGDCVLFNPENDTLTLAPALNDFKSSFWLDGEFNGLADNRFIFRQNEKELAHNAETSFSTTKTETDVVYPENYNKCCNGGAAPTTEIKLERELYRSNNSLEREIKTPIAFPDSRIIARRFEFDYAVSPLPSSDESENQIFVSMSPDGGMTWGESRKIIISKNQGICRLFGFGIGMNMQFKIVCSNKQALNISRITLFYDITMR